jgi:TrmH family RNA methyltransferase
MTLKISSSQNPQVKRAIKLQNRREREQTKRFLIEGFRELTCAVKGGITIEKIFFCSPLFLGKNESALIGEISSLGGVAIETTRAVFEKLTYRDRPDGLIAVALKMDQSLETLAAKMGDSPLLVVAEAVEKPGNLGSIIRSADGVGADGVIVCDRCTDITNPNVVRASVGTLFTQPVIEVDAEPLFTWLKKHQFQVVATSPVAKIDYIEADFQRPTAIVVGTEQLGLSAMWLKSSDIQVSIPMCGVADSLNVATATTLLLYEALRQRKVGNFPWM